MAVIYLRSTDGSDADNGSTWALAKATLAAALTAAGAGGTVYVSQAHSESTAASITLASPGAVTTPVIVLCVNDGAEPPTALATTAIVATGAGSYSITFSGYAYCYGVIFKSGVGGSSSTATIQFGAASALFGWTIENGSLQYAGTGSGTTPGIKVSIAGTTGYGCLVRLINTTLSFGHASQALQVLSGILIWQGSSSAIAGTIPTSLFYPVTSASRSLVQVSGVDLSALSGKNLVQVDSANMGGPQSYYFRNCKLPASITIMNGAIPAPGGISVFLDNCDSADTNYRMEHYKYEGSIVVASGTYKTGGASDGTTPISHKMVSLAGASFAFPLAGVPITAWNETVGSAITVTVDILHDSLTNLQDDEVWLEVEYLGTSGFPLALSADDRCTLLAAFGLSGSPADQTTSAASWTEALANDNEQKLSVTFTPREKGLIRATVMLGKPSYTVYVDPLLVIT